MIGLSVRGLRLCAGPHGSRQSDGKAAIRKRLIAALGAALAISAPSRAHALFGEEDWLSGQNELLLKQIALQLEEITQISQLIVNAKMIVQAANEAAAIARTTFRVYNFIKNYDLADLARDAKEGFYSAIPEARALEQEIAEAVGNVQTLEKGDGAFFARLTRTDARTSQAMRKSFEHGYQAAIWPSVFPTAMKYKDDPSPVDRLIQERYLRTRMDRDQAIQKTAFATLGKKIEAFVEDAEEKDRVDLRAAVTNTQVNLHNAQNSTELLNLEKQDRALDEARRKEDEAFRRGLKQALVDHAGNLIGEGAPRIGGRRGH